MSHGREDGGLPVVLHYVQRWLPLSESFVHDLVTHSRAPAVVCSSDRPENLGVYPFRPLVSLSRVRAAVPFGRARWWALTAALMAVAARHRVGLVHVHHGYRAFEVVRLVRVRRLPLVLSLHGHDVTGLVRQHPDYYRHVVPHAT